MSKQLRLNFILTEFGKLFVAGAKAKGSLKVYTLSETKINRIKIGILGKINIEADENGNATAMEHVFYCSEEHIFDSSDFKSDEFDEKVIDFAVPLSTNLPPSIALKEGSIVYQLYATMEEVFEDGTTQHVNTEANVSVVSLVDCNTIPKAGKGKYVNSTPRGGCMCLQRQEPHDMLEIFPRAYVPGDCIKINVVVFNAQSSPMTMVQVALIQKVKLKYEERSVKVQRVVSDAKRGVVMPQMTQVWHDEMLRIPPVACTTDHKYLKVTYKLKLIPVRHNTDIETAVPLLGVPVFIGNLPLESTLPHFNPLPRFQQFENTELPIPELYQGYARGDTCILKAEGAKFVPSYITYMTERAMDNVELQ